MAKRLNSAALAIRWNDFLCSNRSTPDTQVVSISPSIESFLVLFHNPPKMTSVSFSQYNAFL